MGSEIELTAADGHHLSAYQASPPGKPQGGLVIIQEIFGVTRHIRQVADQYAAAGFLAVAPALFDRVQRGVDVPYTDMTTALGYMKSANIDHALLDIQAALDRVGSAGKRGVVGYCWGGLLSFLSAARLEVDAAVAYYGGGISQHLGEVPRAPLMFHFGEKDAHIPLSAVTQIKDAYPQAPVHLYPADHGFNCTDRASFEPHSAERAFARSVEFLRQNLR